MHTNAKQKKNGIQNLSKEKYNFLCHCLNIHKGAAINYKDNFEKKLYQLFFYS